jgi:hypothetical protein
VVAAGALINVSCDDPGAAIGQQLALPLLQERLDACARDYAAKRAAAAEEAIIKEEVRLSARSTCVTLACSGALSRAGLSALMPLAVVSMRAAPALGNAYPGALSREGLLWFLGKTVPGSHVGCLTVGCRPLRSLLGRCVLPQCLSRAED